MQLSEQIIQIGFAVSLLVNAALFIPQIITILKCKSAKDISLITFAGFNIIQIFILLHGLIEKDYLLVLGYLLSIVTSGTVTILIIYYRLLRKT
jgi:MtN3 and saliva related transmembrane protein